MPTKRRLRWADEIPYDFLASIEQGGVRKHDVVTEALRVELFPAFEGHSPAVDLSAVKVIGLDPCDGYPNCIPGFFTGVDRAIQCVDTQAGDAARTRQDLGTDIRALAEAP